MAPPLNSDKDKQQSEISATDLQDLGDNLKWGLLGIFMRHLLCRTRLVLKSFPQAVTEVITPCPVGEKSKHVNFISLNFWGLGQGRGINLGRAKHNHNYSEKKFLI